MRDIVAGHVEKRYIQPFDYRYREIKRLYTRSLACRLEPGMVRGSVIIDERR